MVKSNMRINVVPRILKDLKNKLLEQNFDSEEGLTLIEAAIGLFILALIIAPLIQLEHIEAKRKTLLDTRGNLSNILESTNEYLISGNGHYPCPSPVNLGEGDTNFGRGGINGTGDCLRTNIPPCTSANWDTNEGICRTTGSDADAVIIGAVPFADLKMSQEEALDFWGNKILYAASYEQLDSATYVEGNGNIDMWVVDNPRGIVEGSEDGTPEIMSDEYEIFFFSTGRTAYGGYNKDGNLIRACQTMLEGYETENCDFDNEFWFDKDPTDLDANSFTEDEQAGTIFFDDITKGQKSYPNPTWYQHADNMAMTSDYEFVMSQATRIAIGITSPENSVHVAGDVRIEDDPGNDGSGNLKSDAFCSNLNDSDCFNTELFAGDMDQMDCEMGEEVVMGIHENRVMCNETTSGSDVTIDTSVLDDHDCGVMKAIGFNSTGDMQCL